MDVTFEPNNIQYLNENIVKYKFPIFKIYSDDNVFIFNQINLIKNNLIVVKNENSNSEIFFECLTGLFKPDDLPEDKEFLKYNIAYKKENVSPKFKGTVKELMDKKYVNKNYYKISKFINLNLFINKNVEDLDILEREKLYFLFTFCSDSDIFIYNYSINKIDRNERQKFLNFLSNFVTKNNKTVFIVENNSSIINKINNKYLLYNIKKIDDNHFYGTI